MSGRAIWLARNPPKSVSLPRIKKMSPNLGTRHFRSSPKDRYSSTELRAIFEGSRPARKRDDRLRAYKRGDARNYQNRPYQQLKAEVGHA